MPVLFDVDDGVSDEELQVNKDYATNYDSWRQKEELNKLKTKYGNLNEEALSDDTDSSSEDEDEDGNVVQFDKEFYKTLAYLKKKDPRIYDGETSFFNADTKEDDKDKKKQTKKEKAISLRDYERKLILERDGKLSDSEDEETFKRKMDDTNAPTYIEEQRQLKESFRNVLNDNENEEEDTGLFKIKEKTEAEKQQEQEDYKEWLKGQKSEIDETEQKELEPLRNYWNDPHLDANEKFLRDYILNDRYRDKEFFDNSDEDRRIHDSDDNLSADEETIAKQEEFEHKYNFRFEEPDKEFIKRYPRTMDNSMRKKDTRRAQKRQDLKQRKEEEKIRKQEELKQLKALKKKEIQEKIEKIKEVTGNDDMRFEDIDLDADFDPEEHDRKMTEMFNDTYYEAPEEDEKPEFPDIDKELEIENNWDDYDINDNAGPSYNDYDGPHCEDEDFNMDADYSESQRASSEAIEGPKRKRKRRNKFAELIAKKKPKYDPKEHPSYQDYFDRYYSLDYEDMIGDLPCRFKYRQVLSNDYGLTVEEILMADDKELNRWCSLKRALRYKPEHVELNDLQVYKRKGSNEALKRKILPSLYTTREEENSQENTQDTPEEPKKKKRRRKKPTGDQNSELVQKNDNNTNNEIKQKNGVQSENKSQSNETKKQQENTHTTKTNEATNNKKSKRKKRSIDCQQDQLQVKKLKTENNESHEIESTKEQKNNKTDTVNADPKDSADKKINGTTDFASNKKKKKFEKKGKKPQKKQIKQKTLSNDVKQVIAINPERLKGYGINAKKFKNKLLYKNDKK